MAEETREPETSGESKPQEVFHLDYYMPIDGLIRLFTSSMTPEDKANLICSMSEEMREAFFCAVPDDNLLEFSKNIPIAELKEREAVEALGTWSPALQNLLDRVTDLPELQIIQAVLDEPDPNRLVPIFYSMSKENMSRVFSAVPDGQKRAFIYNLPHICRTGDAFTVLSSAIVESFGNQGNNIPPNLQEWVDLIKEIDEKIAKIDRESSAGSESQSPDATAAQGQQTEGDADAEADGGAEAGGEGDAEVNADAGAEGDADAGAEADGEGDADAGAEADGEGDADAGAEGKTDSEADAEADAEAEAKAKANAEARAKAVAERENYQEKLEEKEQHFFDNILKNLFQIALFLVRALIRAVYGIILPNNIVFTLLETEMHAFGDMRMADLIVGIMDAQFVFHFEFESRNNKFFHPRLVVYYDHIEAMRLMAGSPAFSLSSAVIYLRARQRNAEKLSMVPDREKASQEIRRFYYNHYDLNDKDVVKELEARFPLSENRDFDMLDSTRISVKSLCEMKVWILFVFYALRAVTSDYKKLKNAYPPETILADIGTVLLSMKADEELHDHPDVHIQLLTSMYTVSRYVFARVGEYELISKIWDKIKPEEVAIMPTLIDYFQEKNMAANRRAEAAEQRADTAEQSLQFANRRADTAEQSLQFANRRADTAEQSLQSLNQKVQTVLAICSQNAANNPLASQIVQTFQP